MFDVRNNLANAVSAELTKHFGDRVFRTIVPRNVRLAEAPSHGQSIVGYDKASAAASPTWAWPAKCCAASASATGAKAHRRRRRRTRHGAPPRSAARPRPGSAARPQGRRRGADAGSHAGRRAAHAAGRLAHAGKYQPRRTMDQGKLSELAESIKAQGVIQPIVVRDLGGRSYEIIAGERRWRASQLAGLSEIPAVIREVDDRTVVAMALIENIQREDLNPLEEAIALQRLIDEFDLTHAQAADAVGRSRAAVSNLLRLLELPSKSACWWKPRRWRWATPARC
jgi:ParB/RepB/Spo0J family partition protein